MVPVGARVVKSGGVGLYGRPPVPLNGRQTLSLTDYSSRRYNEQRVKFVDKLSTLSNTSSLTSTSASSG